MCINVILLYKDIDYGIVYLIFMINLLTDLIALLATKTYDFICMLQSLIRSNKQRINKYMY